MPSSRREPGSGAGKGEFIVQPVVHTLPVTLSPSVVPKENVMFENVVAEVTPDTLSMKVAV